MHAYFYSLAYRSLAPSVPPHARHGRMQREIVVMRLRGGTDQDVFTLRGGESEAEPLDDRQIDWPSSEVRERSRAIRKCCE